MITYHPWPDILQYLLTCSTAHVALFGKRFELAAEEDGVLRRVGLQHEPHVFHHCIPAGQIGTA